ncbi:glycosyltransferase family 2 protein [Patescibacteria group bacterium]|nr:glycosyltransferase family 2 protein [Patescibacteria group bacterium]
MKYFAIMLPKVAIIYLSYNSRPYLDDVVLSLEQLNYPKDQLDLIIVDNASPDNSTDLIRETVLPKSGQSLPEVTFFPSGENLGFAEGNNLGLEHALSEGADYVFLLNNDAKLHPDSIMEAVKLAESDAKIGSVQPLIMLWQDENIINSTGGMIHFLGFGFVRDNGRQLSKVKITNGEEIAYSSGAAVLYRASALRAVGLLDPYLFLYHEDLQLGWRLHLAGYKNVLCSVAVVYHLYEFKRSVSKFFWMERNRILVHFACLKLATLILLIPFLLLLEITLFFFGLKGHWVKDKLLVWWELIQPKTWKYIIKTRKEIQETRQASDREILRLFTAKVEHQATSNFVVNYLGNPLLSAVWWLMKKIIFW